MDNNHKNENAEQALGDVFNGLTGVTLGNFPNKGGKADGPAIALGAMVTLLLKNKEKAVQGVCRW